MQRTDLCARVGPCPKCLRHSGDDWRQCGGDCPMHMSPHHRCPAITPRPVVVEAAAIDPGDLVATRGPLIAESLDNPHMWANVIDVSRVGSRARLTWVGAGARISDTLTAWDPVILSVVRPGERMIEAQRLMVGDEILLDGRWLHVVAVAQPIRDAVPVGTVEGEGAAREFWRLRKNMFLRTVRRLDELARLTQEYGGYDDLL